MLVLVIIFSYITLVLVYIVTKGRKFYRVLYCLVMFINNFRFYNI